MKTLVTLAVYQVSASAYFLKENLEKAGIDCYLEFVYDYEKKTDKIGVQVEDTDVEQAIKIMLGIKDQYGKDIEEIEPVESAARILVPTDFSQASEDACKYAVHLAHRIKAEIKILHVYEDPLAGVNIKESATFLNYSAQKVKEIEQKAKAGIVEFTLKIKSYMETYGIKDVKVHPAVIMGGVIRRINAISSIYNPSFIVLGTSGRREGTKSIFGGLVNEMAKGLGIPICAIPGPFTFREDEKVNILYATDFNEKDNTSLNQLLKIMEPFDKRITCVHIDTDRNPSKLERIDELNNFLKKEYSGQEIICRMIEDTDVYHGIKEFADSNSIHMLSFTTQKRGIFEKLFRPNLFRKILQEANLPILIFPS